MSTQHQGTPAERAVMHILKRMKADPRLAYLIGPGSESFYLLMAAGAAIYAYDVEPYTATYTATLETRPVPGLRESAAVVDAELLARIAEYDNDAHDLDSRDDLKMLVNHFVGRGLTVAEAERDTQTEELF